MDIYRKTHSKRDKHIQVGLTYRALNGQRELDRKSKVYAMHVETPIHIKKTTKKFLRTLAAQKKFPLGVRFRVMDEFFNQMKEPNKQKYRYAKARHHNFIKNLGRIDCTQIVSLDKRIQIDDKRSTTLRNIITNIKDKEDGRRIFATIDEKYNTDDIHIATYRPDKQSKANGFINSLSTYVAWRLPNVPLEGILTLEAIDQSKYESYDPETQVFTTEEDVDLDQELRYDMDDDSFEYLNDDTTKNPFEFDESIKLVGNPKLWKLTGDEDTVSAMTSSSVSFTNNSCIYYDTLSPAILKPPPPKSTNTSLTCDVTDPIHEATSISVSPIKTHKPHPTNPSTPPTNVSNNSDNVDELERLLREVQSKLARARAAPTNDVKAAEQE